MNFLDAYKIVHDFSGAVGKGTLSKEDMFRPTSYLPFKYDKDLIISAFQLFFSHMIFFQTRTPKEVEGYLLVLKSINHFLPNEEVIKTRKVIKLAISKSVFVNKRKQDEAKKLYGDFLKKFTSSYRYDDIINYINSMIDFKNVEILPYMKENKDAGLKNDIEKIIDFYAIKAYELANIEYLDIYRYYYFSFDVLRDFRKNPKYSILFSGYETLIDGSR